MSKYGNGIPENKMNGSSPNPETLLMAAARRGDVETARGLLSSGADLYERRADGATAVDVAFYAGMAEIVKLFFETDRELMRKYTTPGYRGPLDFLRYFLHSVSLPYDEKKGGLYPSAVELHPPWGVLDYLFREGIEIDAKDFEGKTLLHRAAQMDRTDLLKLALECGATAGAADPRGMTALSIAASRENIDAARLLLIYGATADGIALPSSDAAPRDGSTPLHHAAMRSEPDAMKALMLAAFHSSRIDVNAADGCGDTPLHDAASLGNRTAAQLLLVYRAIPGAQNGGGDTPLHKAAARGDAELADVLIVAGADANAANHYKETPLHKAAARGRAGTITALIDSGADPGARDAEGEQPLHHAAWKGHVDAMKALIAGGADPNPSSRNVETPIFKAASAGRLDAVEYLASLDIPLDPVDSFGRIYRGETSLHRAAANGHSDVVRLLVSRGSNPNARDRTGKTPLHIAAANGRGETARALIALGADPAALDDEGKMP